MTRMPVLVLPKRNSMDSSPPDDASSHGFVILVLLAQWSTFNSVPSTCLIPCFITVPALHQATKNYCYIISSFCWKVIGVQRVCAQVPMCDVS